MITLVNIHLLKIEKLNYYKCNNNKNNMNNNYNKINLNFKKYNQNIFQ